MPFPSKWQQKVIQHSKGNIQIVACAGSGKTETITARIVHLLSSGIQPEEIVAFTFTERAAAELLNRIRTRVDEASRKKESLTSTKAKLALLSCGTMHSFCFSLLRRMDPRFSIFEIFSEHQIYALLLRAGVSIGLCGSKNSLRLNNDMSSRFRDEIESFLATLDVIDNELIAELDLLSNTPKLQKVYQEYNSLLERQRIITFSLIIRIAVENLCRRNISNHPLKNVRYLFVDEYQDTNPAQEKLIEEFKRVGTEICVVGDDDQCIYEWRGSNVSNFLNFTNNYQANTYELPENRRCQLNIFRASESLANTIRNRKDKTMLCSSDYPPNTIEKIECATPDQEAELIAKRIVELTSSEEQNETYEYNEIAILLRSVITSGPPILESLSKARVPFRVAGTTALLERPGINTFALLIFAWAESAKVGPNAKEGLSWKGQFSNSLANFIKDFVPSKIEETEKIEATILSLGSKIASSKKPDVVKALSNILELIGIKDINPEIRANPGLLADLGGMTNLISDVQAVYLRNLAKGGYGEGINLINDIAWFIIRYASSNYEANLDYDPSLINAVTVSTVHQAKGLEWPVVFIPSLVEGRFPPFGRKVSRFLPDIMYPEARYNAKFQENQDPERRLFYVALTRAKERLILSRFRRIRQNRKSSPFWKDIPKICFEGTGKKNLRPAVIPRPDEVVSLTCSEIIDYLICSSRYRFRRMWKWIVSLPEELGYGIALHYLTNYIVNENKTKENLEKDVNDIVGKEFHMPYASNFLQNKLQKKASEVIRNFLKKFRKNISNVKMIEQDMVFPISGIRVTCRPDLLINFTENKKWVVDLKSIKDFKPNIVQQDQIRAYVFTMKFMDINVVRGSFYNFETDEILDVPIKEHDLDGMKTRFQKAIAGIKQKEYKGKKGKSCEDCDFANLCFYNQ